MYLSKLALMGVILTCGLGSHARADVSVPSWGLSTGVFCDGDGVGGFFDVVQNPFSDAHYFECGPTNASTAYTAYDFAWSDSGGDFLIEGSQQAHDSSSPPFVRSISNGRIDLISSVDLLFTAEGSYTYDLPAGAMAMAYSLGVLNDQFDHAFFSQGINVDSFLDGSASGTFIIDGQAILPAGEPLHILYSMTMDAYDSSGLYATGSGYFHFTLTPVPEPSTAILCAIGLAILSGTKARRLCRKFS